MEQQNEFDRKIIGIDPGTNLMGYGVVGVRGKAATLIALGVIRLSKITSHYERLSHIYRRISGIVEAYKPNELAIEAPFFGKNVQSMLKLGRAQGVAIAAAMGHGIPISEYEPRVIKMAITGNGAASKEQVREMLKRILKISDEVMPPELDATDALGAAMCHFYESMKPLPTGRGSSWKDFIAKNPDRVRR